MSSDPLLPPDSEPEPTVPPQAVPPLSSTPVTPYTDSPLSTTGLTPNVAAGLAVVTGGIGGVVFLILEKRDAFVRFWAMQSIFFGAGFFVLNIAITILLGILAHVIGFLVFFFWLLYWLVCMGIFAVWVVMLIKSFSGKEWEVPVLGKLAREQLAKTPRL